MTSIRVLVADDHAPTRAGVRAALDSRGFTVVAEAFTATTAVHEAVRTRPDVCLLDVHMPGDGVVAAAEITRLIPQAVVLMITVSEERTDVLRALRAGASGYLLKTIDPDRLAPAVHGALRGEVAIPRTLLPFVLDELRRTESDGRLLPGRRRRPHHLTEREAEVLSLSRLGLTTAQIAQRLVVDPATVRSHLSAARRKLSAGEPPPGSGGGTESADSTTSSRAG